MKARLSHIQIIALGFLLLILAGTLLLSLPVSTRSGDSPAFVTALFTATSASCVTGLVLKDTVTYWSTFGQVVIIVLIQIGGLGFMTVATLFFMLMRRKIGLRQREVMVESLNTTQVGGILRLTREILIGTLIFELAGALLLAIRFIPQFGLWRGIYYSLFHSVSAFCNAGFDLMGIQGEYSSFCSYSGDVLVNITIMMLIIIGGLGFIVWDDLYKNRFNFRRYKLQTKIVLTASFALVFAGAAIFWLLEKDNVEAGLPVGEQILTSLFQSVTARTAGFNTTDTGALTDGSKLLTSLLMFIGGSPGSTAGGIKTTTIVVIFMYVFNSIRHEQSPSIFGRRIQEDTLKKAVSVLFINLMLALGGALIISAFEWLPLADVLFEVFSAIGTVGMTTGITRELCGVSQVVLIILMYLGRVGSVSFAVALLEKRASPPVSYPSEKITIG